MKGHASSDGASSAFNTFLYASRKGRVQDGRKASVVIARPVRTKSADLAGRNRTSANGILEHIRERLGEMIERKEGERSETTKLEICQRRMLARLYQTNEYKSQNNMVGTVMCMSAPGASTKLVRSQSM